MPKNREPEMTEKKSKPSKGKDSHEIGGVEELIKLGKAKGYVTYDEVNELLDDDVTDESDIEDVLTTLRESHVEVREEVEVTPEANAPRRTPQPAGRESETEAEGGADYVRMYMRDMGAVPLLDREGEVTIAKRIEAGEMEVFDLVFGSPFGRQHVRSLRDLLDRAEINVRAVVKVHEPDPVDGDGDLDAEPEDDEAATSEPSEDEIELYKRVTRQLGRLGKTIEKLDDIDEELRRPRLSDARAKELEDSRIKLNKRFVEGLREIPLNPTQVRLAVAEVQRVADRLRDEIGVLERAERRTGRSCDQILELATQTRRRSHERPAHLRHAAHEHRRDPPHRAPDRRLARRDRRDRRQVRPLAGAPIDALRSHRGRAGERPSRRNAISSKRTFVSSSRSPSATTTAGSSSSTSSKRETSAS